MDNQMEIPSDEFDDWLSSITDIQLFEAIEKSYQEFQVLSCDNCSMQFQNSDSFNNHKKTCFIPPDDFDDQLATISDKQLQNMNKKSDQEPSTIQQFNSLGDENQPSSSSGRTKKGKTFQCNRCFSKFNRSIDLHQHKETACSHKSNTHQQDRQMTHNLAETTSPPNSEQVGSGPTAYTFKEKSVRSFLSTRAKETTIEVTFNPSWEGKQLLDLHYELFDMFQEVLDFTFKDYHPNDLGRVVIHHDAIDPIVVPLMKVEELTTDLIMEHLINVLNSHQELTLNTTFKISVAIISMPRGASRVYTTKLRGENNSIARKRSLVQIVNDDNLCMARAIAVAWASKHICGKEEWEELTRNRVRDQSNLDFILTHRKMPRTHYTHVRTKGSKAQRELAEALCHLSKVPLNRKGCITDLPDFEKVLKVRILVIDSSIGNRFSYVGTGGDQDVYLYMVDQDHFHAIVSITGFFSRSYFCQTCLKPYTNLDRHLCEGLCLVCKESHCTESNTPVSCLSCKMECRSKECYDRHKMKPSEKEERISRQTIDVSECKKYWKCTACCKVVKRLDRDMTKVPHICGEWTCQNCKKLVHEPHQCYMRALPPSQENSHQRKLIFFDFECTQSTTYQCQDGYQPDSETRKCCHCREDICGQEQHLPNYVIVQKVCQKCETVPISQICTSCGTRCAWCDKKTKGYYSDPPCPDTCGHRQKTFSGRNASQQFCLWLFTEDNKGATVVAHNMKGYDGVFLLGYMLRNSIIPKTVIYSGSKIMYMYVQKGMELRFIDSLNFFQMPLAKLPDAFDLRVELEGDAELRKGYFPHYFNVPENVNYVGPYPEARYYGADSMPTGPRQKLLDWLQQKRDSGAVFDFAKEMDAYCRSDVTILRQACIKFKSLMKTATKGMIDPFDSVTIAGMCLNTFRTCFLQEEWKVQLHQKTELVQDTRDEGRQIHYQGRWYTQQQLLEEANLVPTLLNTDGSTRLHRNLGWFPASMQAGEMTIQYIEGPSSPSDLSLKGIEVFDKEFLKSPIAILSGQSRSKYSKASIQWLEWEIKKNNICISHALNEGEYHVPGTRFHCDGFCVSTNTVYEFLGCHWHGCPTCYPTDRYLIKIPGTNKSATELHTLTRLREKAIKDRGYNYVSIWEHQFRARLECNSEMRDFVQTLDLMEPIDPRESFFGGRTNAIRLHCQIQPGQEIRYVDFTSLYPWTNKTCRYPEGHPVIINKDFAPLSSYFGLAKVKLLPPRGLFFPVLPFRNQSKLKFALCRVCAEKEQDTPCQHTDEERCFVGTWTTPELAKALEKEYQILKIYQVYHWPKTTQYDPTLKEGGLFAKYINTFLKLKQESSGFPSWCKTVVDCKKYVEQYFAHEGIQLDWDFIEKNKGLRALAKLCLNSLWGKLGQRNNMMSSRYFFKDQVDDFYQLLTDRTKVVQNFNIMNEETVHVSYVSSSEFSPVSTNTNIYLATFTTAWARLKLYDVLDTLREDVLYHDTDSVIYLCRPGENELPLGDYLGELTDELQGDFITEFVSGGPKNYAYRTSKGEEKVCVKGFSLNFTNSRLINFASIKALLMPQNPEERSEPLNKRRKIDTLNNRKISRDKAKNVIYNRPEKKMYRVVYTKRALDLSTLKTLPYGY